MLSDTEAIQSSMRSGTYEPEETAWVRNILGRGSVFVDVGANFGWFTTLARSLVGPEGIVHALEPSPIAYATLHRGLAHDPRVRLHHAAAGRRLGQVDLLLPLEESLHSPSIFRSPGAFEAVSVPLVTLDSLSELWTGRLIDLVKIDVEGSEPDVFEGMMKLIAAGRVKRVLCEFNSWWLAANNSSVAELERKFSDAGFLEERASDWARLPAGDGGFFDLRSVLYRHRSLDA
jgi:FkbM family methyltransferase